MPAQTRGFLFSDLRGYSAFVERHGDRAAKDLLARYRRIVRAAIGRFDGAEVRTEGDSFYVVFSSVSQAVEAGLAIQIGLREPADGEPISAGIGVHAGEVEDDAEQGIVSGAVNIAARVCAVAHPGDVLVTDTVRALTRGYLDVAFLSWGRRRLKGIDDPISLFRVVPSTDAATPGSRRPIARSGPVAIVAAVVVVAAIVTSVAGAGWLRDMRSGTDDSTTADASPAESTMPAPSPTGAAAASDGTSVGPASAAERIAGEARLTTIVDHAVRPSCRPAKPDSLPALYGPGDAGNGWVPRTTPVHFIAGITCAPFGLGAPEELSYWLLSAAGHDSPAVVSADEWVANRTGVLELPAGTCRTDERALERWSAGPVSGRLLCFTSDTLGAVIYWSYDGTGVIGRATSPDGDLQALLDWWGEEARFRDP